MIKEIMIQRLNHWINKYKNDNDNIRLAIYKMMINEIFDMCNDFYKKGLISVSSIKEIEKLKNYRS